MTKSKSRGWIYLLFLKSNGYGFPCERGWLGRIKGAVCRDFDRFEREGLYRFLLAREEDGGEKGLLYAVRLGGLLNGRGGGACAAAGLLTPWMLGELGPDVALHWLCAHPLWGPLLFTAKAAVLATALIGVLDFRDLLSSPMELLLLAGGLLDCIYGWFPGTLALLGAVGWVIARGALQGGRGMTQV